MIDFKKLRQEMVQEQVAARGIKDPRVLQAMERVEREHFVDPELTKFAYEDTPLPIEERQTISQPFIVALMAEKAKIAPADKVLEVGTGSGYSAAVLSLLASHVYSIERHPQLASTAQERLKRGGYSNVTVIVGDGTLGWSEFAPYQVILVTASGPQAPPSLLKQLAVKGRLVMPIGSPLDNQQLIRMIRKGDSHYSYESICPVRFVSLIGQEGWKI